MNRIKKHLEAQDGVREVGLNQSTGSIKVDYDRQRRTAADILGL